MNEEQLRLASAHDGVPWRRWGPYLSERQWGTVREDYGDGNNTWDFVSHDAARSYAYRWGEDGIAGISDEQQLLCFALAFWNGTDPILKERLFGLSNAEGNHGEDVKEYYFYLDSTPTHSYMRYLYKYPQSRFPYENLVEESAKRSSSEPEYELVDTGAFDGSRYFDIFVEYAKATPEDICVRITAHNRGSVAAPLDIIPTIWFRNTWEKGSTTQRRLELAGQGRIVATEGRPLAQLSAMADPELLFTENETNSERLSGTANKARWAKDAFHAYIVDGLRDAINPSQTGTKAAALYHFNIEPGSVVEVRLRLTPPDPTADLDFLLGADFDAVFNQRIKEANDFYEDLSPPRMTQDERLVMRQALAGMLWSKQYYAYDVARWLTDHGVDPYGTNGASQRNASWAHLANSDIISMPDKWEYPWYAAWDLAFHALALDVVDPEFAKQQLQLVLGPRYLHPNGQIPAYEWNFGDVNPPVHAFATWFLYTQEKIRQGGVGDTRFLEGIFQRLLMNFTWWVNRKDPQGANVFEGGFLGLDNIGVFDRSAPLPTGGHLEQADGTAWMAFYSQMMLQIALELSITNPAYKDLALKFAEHFLWIAGAMDRGGQGDLWDEEDGFFYDLLRLPDGSVRRLKVRSMVGLLSICASSVFPPEVQNRVPDLTQSLREFVDRHPQLTSRIAPPGRPGYGNRRLLALLTDEKLKSVLRYMLDENEFLSPYGIRALSRYHDQHPFEFQSDGISQMVDYEPAESNSRMFGGNSNWRGPIWLPVNALLIRGLLNLYAYYGKEFTVECPTGSGVQMNLFEVAEEINRRLSSLFLRDASGRRPANATFGRFQSDPDWKDLVSFYEYFNGETGSGLGASHQTGWTGLVAPLMRIFATVDADSLLEGRERIGAASSVRTGVNVDAS